MKPTGSSGGFRVRKIHQLERALVKLYELEDRDDLHRLAIFILVHTLVDELLSTAVINHELFGLSKEDPIETLAARVAKDVGYRPFSRRLADAKRRRVLSANSHRIAKALNERRNEFIHGHRIPLYKGKKITSDQGLYNCLSEAISIIEDFRQDAARQQGSLNRMK
jgi:hypothetical protein